MTDLITGLDGKRYPAAWLSADDRSYLAGAVHELHCGSQRLSVRRLLARIHETHGIRRSLGWAAGILKTQRCDHCSGESSGVPEQVGEAAG